MTTNSGKTCKSLTRKYLKEFIKGKKKSDQRAQAFFVEDYVHDLLSPFTKLKGKSYRSMFKSEKPHEM